MPTDYTKIESGYNDYLERLEETDQTINEVQPSVGMNIINSPSDLKDGVVSNNSFSDVYIKNFIKSVNYKPKSTGFMIDGLKGYIECMNIHAIGTVTASSGTIGGWSIGSTSLSSGTTHIVLDSSNKAIYINSSTFGNSGIQIEYNGGTPRVYVGDGSNAFFKYDGVKATWKSANSELDTSGNMTISGGVVQWATISGTTDAPDDNADVTGDNTANDTSNVNSIGASEVQTDAQAIFKEILFLGSQNDGLTEVAGGTLE